MNCMQFLKDTKVQESWSTLICVHFGRYFKTRIVLNVIFFTLKASGEFSKEASKVIDGIIKVFEPKQIFLLLRLYTHQPLY